jgi:hypothetical protein
MSLNLQRKRSFHFSISHLRSTGSIPLWRVSAWKFLRQSVIARTGMSCKSSLKRTTEMGSPVMFSLSRTDVCILLIMGYNQTKIDEIIGVVRCARCGHRLNGEIECPFCSIIDRKSDRKDVLPKWVYITACFLTSPLSIYFIFGSNRLNVFEKILALSGCLIWSGIYFLWQRF